jgi:hypothetical protein
MKKITYIVGIFLFYCISFSQVGIGNIDPATSLDVSGAISLREGTALNLTNGNNNNVNLGTIPSSFYRIIGPTAAFTIGSIIPISTADGQIVTIQNTTAFDFTIRHDISGVATNRIFCPGGGNLVLSGIYATVTLTYNKTYNRWTVIGSTDNPYGRNIQSSTGSTDITKGNNTFSQMNAMNITFTPKHNVVYLNFSASGYADLTGNPSGMFADFRIVNVTAGNTVVAGTSTLVTDHDDLDGTATSWNVSFAMYPISVTAGIPVNLIIQWRRDGIIATNLINNSSTENNYCHRNLTIYD